MGRKRKNDTQGLPQRVYLKHGAFYYVHPTGRWERIGTDLQEANRRGALYNDQDGLHGTMGYYLDQFILSCKRRVGLPKVRRGLSQRTADDYAENVPYLKAFFGKMPPNQVQGHHVAEYLDMNAEAGRPVRANREKACLSACFSWLMRQPGTGVRANPCIGIARNPESRRERYIEHEEYQLILGRAQKTVQALMELVYRTLQRPEDIIRWTPAHIVRKREPDGSFQRILRTVQSKTGATVDILITPEMETILAAVQPPGAALGPGVTYIRKRNGDAYTYAGLSTMFRANVAAAVAKGLLTSSFTLYDIKGKGATDMWLAGTDMSLIQALCGHDSVTTTEIYVKSRWRGTVTPNQTVMPLSNIAASST